MLMLITIWRQIYLKITLKNLFLTFKFLITLKNLS